MSRPLDVPAEHDEVLELRIERLALANRAILSAGLKNIFREKFRAVFCESNHLRLLVAIPGLPLEVRRAVATYLIASDVESLCAMERRVLGAVSSVHGHVLFERAGYCGYKAIFCDPRWAYDYSDVEHDYNTLVTTHSVQLQKVLPPVHRYALSASTLGLATRADSAWALHTIMRDIIARCDCLHGPRCRSCGYNRMKRDKFWECVRRGRPSAQDLFSLRRHLDVIRDRHWSEEIPTVFDMRTLVEHLPEDFVGAWNDATLRALQSTPQSGTSSSISITSWHGFVQDARQCSSVDGRRRQTCLAYDLDLTPSDQSFLPSQVVRLPSAHTRIVADSAPPRRTFTSCFPDGIATIQSGHGLNRTQFGMQVASSPTGVSGRYVDAHSPLWILLREEANGEMSVTLPAGPAFAPRLTHYGFYIVFVGEALSSAM